MTRGHYDTIVGITHKITTSSRHGGTEPRARQLIPMSCGRIVSLWRMKMNRKECIDDLNYIRKALTKGSLYQHDAIIFLIDTLTEYLKEDETQGVESGEKV